jgi:hypothetical protein
LEINAMRTPVLFVGGPSDGRLVDLAHAPLVFKAAVFPPLVEPCGVGAVEGQVFLNIEHFEYIRFPIGRHTFYIPSDWPRGVVDPYARVRQARTRGYVGRA